ncbi:MAG TPA: hypothetical protein VJA16_01260 [Thermoanaerobaculia bacterium]
MDESFAVATTATERAAAIDGMEVEIEMQEAAVTWRARGGLVSALPTEA